MTIAGESGAWTGRLDLNNSGMIIKNGSNAIVANQIANALYGPGSVDGQWHHLQRCSG